MDCREASAAGSPRGGETGQATVEYLLVGLVVMIVVVVLAALWRYVGGGQLTGTLSMNAAYAVGTPGGAADALLF